MKKNNPIFFILLIVIAIALYFFMNNKEVKKINQRKINTNQSIQKDIVLENLIVENSFEDIVLEGEGIVCLKNTFPIISSRDGIIDSINIYEGKLNKKGELLFIFENNDLFNKMSERKVKLKQLLVSALNEFNSTEIQNMLWKNFLDSLNPKLILPVFPKVSEKSLMDIFKKNSVIKLYNQLVDDEETMNSFFVISKKSSKISNILIKKGDEVKKGDTLAFCEENIPDLVKVNLEKNEIYKIKTADKILFYDENNSFIGKGKFFFLKSENKKEVVYLSIVLNDNQQNRYGKNVKFKSSKIGMEEGFKIPKNYFLSDSSLIVNSNKMKLSIISSSNDFYFVTGLNDGDTICPIQK